MPNYFINIYTFIFLGACSFTLLAETLDFSSLRNPGADQAIHLQVPKNRIHTEKLIHPRDRQINGIPQAYFIDITADPETGMIEGTTTITMHLQDPLDLRVSVDAAYMQIKSVRNHNGDPLQYSYDGRVLQVQLRDKKHDKDEHQISIQYRAASSQHYFLTGPDASDPHRAIASFTFTQPEGSQHWFPCIDRPDAKALLDIKISTPRPYKALSNGIMLPIKRQGNKNQFHYRMDIPIAPYLISLAIGEFLVFDLGTLSNKPLELWVPPAIARAALTEVKHTKKMMQTFGDFTGVSYPFASYRQSVAQAWSSSMEHQSATTMGGWRIRGDLSGEGVVAHELAHQWFGDWVTCESWQEMWLNEGFASYLPYVYFTEHGNLSGAMDYRLWWREGYFAESNRYTRPLSSPDNQIDTIFDAHSYEKGALVIHLMRSIANRIPISPVNQKELFSQALKTYLESQGGGNVSNTDLQAALEEVTGQSWQQFFDHWVRSQGHPVISAKIYIRENALVGSIEQVQATRSKNKWSVFSFPLDIEILGLQGQRVLKILDIYQETQSFKFDLDFSPVAFNLDPKLIVPAQIQFKTPSLQMRENWLQVLKASPIVTSRLMALGRLLKEKPTQQQYQDYLNLLKADESVYLKAESMALLSQHEDSLWIIEKIIEHLETLPPEEFDLSIRRAVAHSRAWLVKHRQKPSSQQELSRWQRGFMRTPFTSEREAILSKLAYANLSLAQDFALQRLREDHWVTKDRTHLIDVLTKYPSSKSQEFILQMLESGSYHWFKRIVNHLVSAEYQAASISDALIRRIKSSSLDNEVILGLELLAIQNPDKHLICPFLEELRAADLSNRMHGEKIKLSSKAAENSLRCQGNN